MRNLCSTVLSALSSANTNGTQIDSNQLVSASFHIFFSDTSAAGTFKLQASNDPCAFGNIAKDFTVTNWVDIPSQTATISSGASAILTVPNMTYRWIRAVYANTAMTPIGNVTVNINALGI